MTKSIFEPFDLAVGAFYDAVKYVEPNKAKPVRWFIRRELRRPMIMDPGMYQYMTLPNHEELYGFLMNAPITFERAENMPEGVNARLVTNGPFFADVDIELPE